MLSLGADLMGDVSLAEASRMNGAVQKFGLSLVLW
jgi:hypothetical protein